MTAVLGISGSLRRDSYNTALLRAAAEQLPPGVELEIFEGLKAIPPYDQDEEQESAPPPVTALRQAVAGADAVLFATPEYNASIPGQLKNALDWLSRPLLTSPLRFKPVAVVGASTGAFGAVWAQTELRKVLASIGARVIPGELPVAHAATRFDGDGTLVDDEVRSALAEQLERLISEVDLAPAPTQPVAA